MRFTGSLGPTIRSLQPAASGVHRDMETKVGHLDVVTVAYCIILC